MPDYLEGVTLRGLAVLCADLEHKREIFLLQAEHVAAMPIPVELHMESVRRSVAKAGRIHFSELIAAGAPIEIVIVTLLAVLELYKQGAVDVRQDLLFGDIEIAAKEGAEA